MKCRALSDPAVRPAHRARPRELLLLALLLGGLLYLPATGETAFAEGAEEYAFVTTWLWPEQRHDFVAPQGVAVAPDGSVYVADTGRDRIQKFTATGGFMAMWGSPGSGPGQFNEPMDVAVGPDDSVYVVDSYDARVQKFDAAGTYVTAWDGSAGSAGAFAGPCGVAVDQDGYVYVADTANDRIQKFTSAGVYVTAWGGSGSANGEFSFPVDVAVGQNGYVYVSDRYNARVQRFTTAGAFVSAWGDYGSGNGLFMGPSSVAVGGDGSVYVGDQNNSRVQKFTATGGYLTQWGSAGDGDGQFDWDDVFAQVGLAVSSGGTVYVGDAGHDRIQAFALGGGFTAAWDEYYGQRYPLVMYYDEYERGDYRVDRFGSLWDDAEYNEARLWRVTSYTGGDYREPGPSEKIYEGPKLVREVFYPLGVYVEADAEEDIAVGPDGTVYVVDSNKPGIQRFTVDGTFVGQWPPVWALALCADDDGDVYVVDRREVQRYDFYGNPYPVETMFRIQRLASGGGLLTTWELQFVEDFTSAAGVAVDGAGYVYLALTSKNRIYKFAPGGGGSVGNWGGSGSANGQFSGPYGIAVDDAGYVYVSDLGNDRIQKFNSSGAFQTKWGVPGSADGAFDLPSRLAVGADGSVFVADCLNHRIQKFTSTGGFLTKWGTQGDGDGEFDMPGSVAVGPGGAVYVVDTGNHRRVQKFAPSADATPPTTSHDYDNLWHNGAVAVTLSATDNDGGSGMVGGEAKTEYSRDGGASWTQGTSVTFPVWRRGGGSGVHTLLYRSTDAAGNSEEANSVDVKIDARPPLTGDDAPAEPQASDVTVHLTAADSLFGVTACSGLATTWYRLDDGQWTEGSEVSVSGAGVHWISYYSTDLTGNAEYEHSCSVTILAGGGRAAQRPTRSPAGVLASRRVSAVRALR